MIKYCMEFQCISVTRKCIINIQTRRKTHVCRTVAVRHFEQNGLTGGIFYLKNSSQSEREYQASYIPRLRELLIWHPQNQSGHSLTWFHSSVVQLVGVDQTRCPLKNVPPGRILYIHITIVSPR